MSFQGQISFGYPLTAHNIITTAPDNAVLPLSIGSSLQGNVLGITVANLLAAVPTPPGLPSFIEYDETTKTFWNNGSNDVTVNTSFGALALTLNSSGASNTAYGYATLFRNADGNNNTAVGSNALDNNISNSFNTALGAFALQRTRGDRNTGLGASALKYNTTGQSNVGIGFGTLGNNTTGSNNTVIGDGAMRDSTVSSLNTVIGYSALERGTGNGNTAIGYSAGQFNEGSGNIAIGFSALQPGFSAASNNIAIGNDSFYRLTTGSNNVGIGRFSMAFCQTGTYNVAIGDNADSQNFSGSVILGADAQATANNQFVVGSTSYNAGAIASETITANRTWTVRINGANYKIPLLAI
jgi:hypothetical protein